MYTLLVAAHLTIAISIIIVVLLQRSEGQTLGVSDAQAFSRRAAVHPLSRLTAILAALFMATSLGLSVAGQHGRNPMSILDKAAPPSQEEKAPESPPKPSVPFRPRLPLQ